MESRSLFRDSSGELRSGWKAGLYFVLLVGLLIGTAVVPLAIVVFVYGNLQAVPGNDIWWLAVNTLAQLMPAAGAFLFMAKVVEGVPIAVFGVAFHDRWFRDFVIGLAVASGMLGVVMAGSSFLGEVHMDWNAPSIPKLGLTLAVLAVAAATEELVFRGYPLQVLMKGLTPWGATLLISSLFGLLHVGNPGASTLSVLNTILAGVMLSAAYMKTRSLWLPYGIHFGWNAGLGVVLGFPMSGLNLESVLKADMSGPPGILGGSYGPEAGLLGTVVFAAAMATVLALRSVKVSAQIGATIARYTKRARTEET